MLSFGRSLRILAALAGAASALAIPSELRAQDPPPSRESPEGAPIAPSAQGDTSPDATPAPRIDPDAPRIDAEAPSEVPPPPLLVPEGAETAPPPLASSFIQRPRFVVDEQAEAAQKMDLLYPLSIGSLALGGAFVLSGGITLAAREGNEYCGITGCVERPTPLETNIGASLIGAGSGFALVGAMGFLGWATNRPEGDEFRKSNPMMTVGFAATSLAASSLGLGIGQALTYDDRSTDFTSAWPFLLTSVVLSGVGIPLLAVGSVHKSPAILARERQERAERRAKGIEADGRPPMRSKGMVIAGGVLTGIGGLALLTGVTFIGLDVASQGEPGYVSLLIGAPLLGGTLLFGSIGIPLIVVGAKRDTDPDDVAMKLVPDVDAGPAGLRATWRLP